MEMDERFSHIAKDPRFKVILYQIDGFKEFND